MVKERYEFAQATISLRWLVLAILIAKEALTPDPTPPAVLLYAGTLLYTLGLTLYAWRFPARAVTAAKWGVPLDTAVVILGMQLTAYPQEFLILSLLVATVGGLLLGSVGATAVGTAITLVQLPIVRASVFAPGQWAGWAIAGFSLLAAGNGAASIVTRLAARTDLPRRLLEFKRIVSEPAESGDVAMMALAAAVRQFSAGSGSLMVFDPQAKHLEILAAYQIDDAYREARLRLGEGIAGWVVQGGRAVLLTPNAAVPFRLLRSEIGSSMCVPVAVESRPLGVLNLNRPPGKPLFTEDDLEAAELVAQVASGLLVRVQYERTFSTALADLAAGFSDVRHALSRDPAVLWPALLDVARSLASAPFAVLALERDDTGNIDIVASRGIEGAAARKYLPALLAASTHGEVQRTDGQSPGPGGAAAQSTLPRVVCVPLAIASRVIGAIGFGLSDGAPPAQPLLRAVAAHVAAAVHTARTAHQVADIGVLEERRRIAREMHDGLAQTLADALLQIDLAAMAAQSNPSHLAGDLKELRGLLERAMRELREFMSDLRRQEEVEGGLRSALDSLEREFERHYTIPVSVVFSGDDTQLPSAVRHALLAIVRQALTNVRTHAQATAVTIRVDLTERECAAAVTDDGVGFDLTAYRARPPAAHHLGLTSMEERAALLGGRLQILSAPGRGTTVSVRIPMGSVRT